MDFFWDVFWARANHPLPIAFTRCLIHDTIRPSLHLTFYVPDSNFIKATLVGISRVPSTVLASTAFIRRTISLSLRVCQLHFLVLVGISFASLAKPLSFLVPQEFLSLPSLLCSAAVLERPVGFQFVIGYPYLCFYLLV